MEPDMKPLAGIRVVEITQYVAGPTAGMVLGDWGADVIKLEPLTGEPQRYQLFTGDSSPYNYFWEWANRNKRGVAVDLKHPRGKEITYRLIERADIFVTNFRVKALGKLGLDYKTLSQANPRLIYAHSTGYGPQGPDSEKASFDGLATWMRSGLMACHSFAELTPVMARSAVGDTPTGFFLAAGVVLGLMQRQRTGKGLEVNASLLATGMWINIWAIQKYIASGTSVRQHNRDTSANPIYNTYPTKDGWLQLDLFREGEWGDLCRALGREELIADPRFATAEKRSQNNLLLISFLEEVFRSRTTEEWKTCLNQYDLAWEAMQDADQVVVDPQVIANHYLIEVEHPKEGSIKEVANPIQFHHSPFPGHRPAPDLGQHTAEVLQELGYTQKEIQELEQMGAIRCGQSAVPRS